MIKLKNWNFLICAKLSNTIPQGISFNTRVVDYCPNLGWRIPDYWKLSKAIFLVKAWTQTMFWFFFIFYPPHMSNILLCLGGLLWNTETKRGQTSFLPEGYHDYLCQAGERDISLAVSTLPKPPGSSRWFQTKISPTVLPKVIRSQNWAGGHPCVSEVVLMRVGVRQENGWWE